MDLADLTKQAQGVRDKYARLEKDKYGKQWTTQDIAQGFVGDVGDLMKLVQAKSGIRDTDDVDRKVAHELADCLWSILILADEYDVDLESSFTTTMSELNKKLK